MSKLFNKMRSRAESFGVLKTVIALLLLISTAATLVFIFSNSAKSQAESNAQSSSIKDMIEQVVSKDSELGSWILDNLRKIAHFTEYGLLGIEVSLFVFLISKERKKTYKRLAMSLMFSLCVAFVDETVQIFSKRGPSVSDMWIDVGGFFAYALFTLCVYEAVSLIVKCLKKCKKRVKNG